MRKVQGVGIVTFASFVEDRAKAIAEGTRPEHMPKLAIQRMDGEPERWHTFDVADDLQAARERCGVLYVKEFANRFRVRPDGACHSEFVLLDLSAGWPVETFGDTYTEFLAKGGEIDLED